MIRRLEEKGRERLLYIILHIAHPAREKPKKSTDAPPALSTKQANLPHSTSTPLARNDCYKTQTEPGPNPPKPPRQDAAVRDETIANTTNTQSIQHSTYSRPPATTSSSSIMIMIACKTNLGKTRELEKWRKRKEKIPNPKPNRFLLHCQ